MAPSRKSFVANAPLVICALFLFLAPALCGIATAQDVSPPYPPEAEPEKKFSPRERRWAVSWINGKLSVIMGSGAIQKIIDNDEVYEIYVGPPWYKLPFSTRGAMLQELSRVREITGHSPFFSALDSSSHEVTAVISEYGIKILVTGEGFFSFITESRPSGETVY